MVWLQKMEPEQTGRKARRAGFIQFLQHTALTGKIKF